jgi:hypothetical protein
MKRTSGGGENESAETQWPRVAKIAGEEFQQSYAVAQLAAKLCELKKASPRIPAEKENLDPAKFFDEAWKLIESARDRVLREQTEAEYLAARGGSREAAENAVVRILSASRVPFQKVCNPKSNKGDTKTIYGVSWKVFTTERGFDDLFWAYWNDIGEKWKNPKQAEEQGKLRVDGPSRSDVFRRRTSAVSEGCSRCRCLEATREAEAR